jgi:hypothetical protein
MAKAKQMDLPSVAIPTGKQSGQVQARQSAMPSRSQVDAVVESVKVEPVAGGSIGVIEVPMLHGFQAGFVRRRVDIKLNRDQAANLKSIQLGLEMREAKLLDGRVVNDPVDAIRWMLENLVS